MLLVMLLVIIIHFFIHRFVGFAFHFCLLFIAITWFLHLFHLFLGLAFPFWTSNFFSEAGQRWKLCILEVLGAILFSSSGPIIVLSISEYRLGRFPPLFPRPNKDLTLYTLMLPLTILLAVGVNLTFFCFWTIHKVWTLLYYITTLMMLHINIWVMYTYSK